EDPQYAKYVGKDDVQHGDEHNGTHDSHEQHTPYDQGRTPQLKPLEPRAERDGEADRWRIQRALRHQHTARKEEVGNREIGDGDPREPERFDPTAAPPRVAEQRAPNRETGEANQEPTIERRGDERALG